MSDKRDDDPEAMPVGCKGRLRTVKDPGMSLRDYFAGQALAGMLANDYGRLHEEDAAESSYLQANSMLKKREREEG